MIRKWKEEDREMVMELWLISNTEVHSFIPLKYWQQNYKEIQRVIPIAETYVYEHQGKVKGFVSAMEGFLLGIFVDSAIRKHGMGTLLMDRIMQNEENLTVTVYEKNVDAVRFFMRQQFKVESEVTEDSTGEKQLMMVWNRK